MRPGPPRLLEHLVVGRQPVPAEQGGLFGMWVASIVAPRPVRQGTREGPGPEDGGPPSTCAGISPDVSRAARDRGRGEVRPGARRSREVRGPTAGRTSLFVSCDPATIQSQAVRNGGPARYNGIQEWRRGERATSGGAPTADDPFQRGACNDVPDEPGGCVDRGSVRDPGGAVRGPGPRPAGGGRPGRRPVPPDPRRQPAGRRVGDDRAGDAQGRGPRRRPGAGRLPRQGPVPVHQQRIRPRAGQRPGRLRGRGRRDGPGQPGPRRQPRLPRDDRPLSDWPSQNANGSWDYSGRSNGDTSITQYAVLGLWEAENCRRRRPPRRLGADRELVHVHPVRRRRLDLSQGRAGQLPRDRGDDDRRGRQPADLPPPARALPAGPAEPPAPCWRASPPRRGPTSSRPSASRRSSSRSAGGCRGSRRTSPRAADGRDHPLLHALRHRAYGRPGRPPDDRPARLVRERAGDSSAGPRRPTARGTAITAPR